MLVKCLINNIVYYESMAKNHCMAFVEFVAGVL